MNERRGRIWELVRGEQKMGMNEYIPIQKQSQSGKMKANDSSGLAKKVGKE